MKSISKKIIPYLIAVPIALVVLGVLLYSNFTIINFIPHFQKPDPYKDKMVLFFGDKCDQCVKVDVFIKANKVKDSIAFDELEVFNNPDNFNILSDKIQVCGLNIRQVGVPFLWDGKTKQCVYGYVDVINFFKEELKVLPKK